ncbi:MAG: hypothetical protein ABFD81_10190 [Syntrophaceae bacterium]
MALFKKESIELGDRVKDKISGISGIAVGVTEWLYGCRRFVLQPEETKDGRPVESFSLDEPQLELIKKNPLNKKKASPEKETRRHGPKPEPSRHEL